MSAPSEPLPLDAGDWFAWRMFVEAAGVACSPAVLGLALAGLVFCHAPESLLNTGDTAAGVGQPAAPSLEPRDLIIAATNDLRQYLFTLVDFTVQSRGGWLEKIFGLMPVLAWSVAGAAIARIAALRLTRRDGLGPGGAIAWSTKTLPARVGLLLSLMVVALLMNAVVWLLGKAASVPFIGPVVDFLLPITLLIAAVPALFWLGLKIGWPLMTVAAGVERPDGFDHVSRGIAYAYQRPLRLVAYSSQALVVGVAGGAVANLLVRAALRTGVLWAEARGGELSDVAGFWWSAATRVPLVYHAAYFWCAATAIYLLLRRDIDEQQADEVFIEEPPSADPALSAQSADA